MISIRFSRFIVALATATCAIAAHAWPDRVVRLVVPGGPGGAPDVSARLVGEKMGSELGQSVIVENRVGAGGIAALQAMRTARDNHTFLLVITSTSSIAPLTLKGAADVDYLRDLQPVARMATTPLMIVASHASGAKSLGDVLRLGKDRPGEVVFAIPPPSTLAHLAVELIQQSSGAQFNVVPFARSSESVPAVVNGDASFFIDGVSVVLPMVREGRLVPIAVLSRSKFPGLEAYALGRDTMPDLEAVAHLGLMTSKDTSKEAVDKMAKALAVALADPEVVRRLSGLGLFPMPGGASDYRAVLESDADLWGKVVRRARLTPE